jgi:hypothetical protein
MFRGKPHESEVRIASVLAETETEYLQKGGPELYR